MLTPHFLVVIVVVVDVVVFIVVFLVLDLVMNFFGVLVDVRIICSK